MHYLVLRAPTDHDPSGYFSYNREWPTLEQAKEYLNGLYENFKNHHIVEYTNESKTEFINKSNKTRTYIIMINHGTDKIETLTSKNQFNYSIKQIIINYSAKVYEVRHGAECRIEKKNSTTKAINNKIEELKAAGFICLNGGGNE